MITGLLIVVIGLCSMLLVCSVVVLRIDAQRVVLVCVSKMSFCCLTMSCTGMFMSDRCGSVCMVGTVMGVDHFFR